MPIGYSSGPPISSRACWPPVGSGGSPPPRRPGPMRPPPINAAARSVLIPAEPLANWDRGTGMSVAETAPAPKESFAALLNESMGMANGLEGTVVKGRVISIENDAALIDVGLKSEGRVALKEFSVNGGAPEIKVGDPVEGFLG